MNVMYESGTIKEMSDGKNLAYILQEPKLFFFTGYKVLQSQEKKGFVKCTRVSHNGKDKLVYDISKYKTLESLLPAIPPEFMLKIVIRMLDIILEVKDNGFIQCENIILTFDKVYIDCEDNYQVHFIYLPVEIQSTRSSYIIFESQFKANLIMALDTYPNLRCEPFVRIYEKLKNPDFSLDTIVSELRKKPRPSVQQQRPFQTAPQAPAAYREPASRQQAPVPPRQTPVQSPAVQKPPATAPQYPAQTGALRERQSHSTSALGRQVPPQQSAAVPPMEAQYSQPQQMPAQQAPMRQQGTGPTVGDRTRQLSMGSPTSNNMHAEPARNTYQPGNTQYPLDVDGEGTTVLEEGFTPALIFSGMRTPEAVEIYIDKPEFILGKRADAVDGAIRFNSAISRLHCKIVNMNGRNFIADLGSANGTFVNGTRVSVGHPVEIYPGDVIRLANSNFTIKTI